MNRGFNRVDKTVPTNHVAGAIALDPEWIANDAQQLNPRIHEWPEDRQFLDNPDAPLTEFFTAYFKHPSQVAIDFEAEKVEPDAKERAHDLPQPTVNEAIERKSATQLQIKQVRQNVGTFSS